MSSVSVESRLTLDKNIVRDWIECRLKRLTFFMTLGIPAWGFIESISIRPISLPR